MKEKITKEQFDQHIQDVVDSLKNSEWYAGKVLEALERYGLPTKHGGDVSAIIMRNGESHFYWFTNTPELYTDKVELFPCDPKILEFYLCFEIVRQLEDTIDFSKYKYVAITKKPYVSVKDQSAPIENSKTPWYKRF